jgi:hypothetical protein
MSTGKISPVPAATGGSLFTSSQAMIAAAAAGVFCLAVTYKALFSEDSSARGQLRRQLSADGEVDFVPADVARMTMIAASVRHRVKELKDQSTALKFAENRDAAEKVRRALGENITDILLELDAIDARDDEARMVRKQLVAEVLAASEFIKHA